MPHDPSKRLGEQLINLATLAYVLEGAIEHDLPEDVIAAIRPTLVTTHGAIDRISAAHADAAAWAADHVLRES